MIETDPLGFLAALGAMMAALYTMRATGYWLIGRVPIGPRLRRMLEALPGAVIVATVLPIMIKGGISALVGVGAAAAVMTAVRNDLAAVVVGVAAAALVRAAGL